MIEYFECQRYEGRGISRDSAYELKLEEIIFFTCLSFDRSLNNVEMARNWQCRFVEDTVFDACEH